MTKTLTKYSHVSDKNPGFALNLNNVLTVAYPGMLICNGGSFSSGSVANFGTIDCLGYGYTWIGAAGDSNWTTPTNWSGGVVPGVNDIPTFKDSYCGANCNAVFNAAVSVRGLRMLTGYTGTVTQGAGATFTLGTSGVTQWAGNFIGGNSAMSFSGPSILTAGNFTATSGTLTSSAAITTGAGLTFNHNSGTVVLNTTGTGITATTLNLYHLQLAATAPTFTFAGTIIINGNLTLTNYTTSTSTIGLLNGGILDTRGNVTNVATTLNTPGFGGTTQIIFGGAANQTYSEVNTNNARVPNVLINKSGGTLTIANDLMVRSGFTYTAGTVDWGVNALQLVDSTQTLSPGSLTYNNVIFACGACTYTVVGTWNINGNLSLSSWVGTTSTFNYINGGTINVAGNVANIAASIANTPGFSGSTNIVFTGAGNQSYTMTNTNSARMPKVTIDKSGGTLTFANNIFVASGFTYVGGSVDWGINYLFLADNNQTITPGALTYNTVGFGCAACTFTVVGTWNILGNVNLNSWAGNTSTFVTLNGGTLYVSGNVTNVASSVTNAPGYRGTTEFVFTGSGNQTYTQTNTAVARIPKVTVDKSGGTLTIASDLLTHSGFTYVGGNVAWGIQRFYPVDGPQTITPGSLVFGDVLFGASTGAFTISGTMNVAGNLQLSNWAGVGTYISINSGFIDVTGNILSSGSFAGTSGFNGTTVIRLVSSGPQTISNGVPTNPNLPTIIKTGTGTVTQTGPTRTAPGKTLTISAGTWDMAGYNLSVGGGTPALLTNNGTLIRGANPSCGTLTYSSLSGTAAICP